MGTKNKLRVGYNLPGYTDTFTYWSADSKDECYRIEQGLERLTKWLAVINLIDVQQPIIVVQMYDESPEESPDVNPDAKPVGWVHFWDFEEDCDWETYKSKYFIQQ